MSDKETDDPKPEEFPKDLQEMIRKLGGHVVSLQMPPGATPGTESPPAEEDGDEISKKQSEALRFDLKPAEVKTHLDRFVIGQEDAKKTLSVAVCDHYNHVRRVHRERAKSGSGGGDGHDALGRDYVKQNVILLGPTGVGKTYILRTVAQLMGVPFVKADITKFSETGYVGGDVDDLVRELVRAADGDVTLAEYGIIFLDEIDKIASSSNIMGRDVSGRGVQTGLLKLLEETEVSARSPNDMTAQFQDLLGGGAKKGKATINTRNILFVVSGAFSGLDELIETRLSQQSIGFATTDEPASREPGKNILEHVSTKDFVDYGFEPEFIGRLPIRVALDDLTRDDLFEILENSEGSILKQYRENFADYGIDVAFTSEALELVASRAIDEKTGARGLMTVLDSATRDFKFHLPGTAVKKFLVSADVLEHSQEFLERILDAPEEATVEFARHEVAQFGNDFADRYGIALEFDDAAVEMAIGVSRELDLGLQKYLETTFNKHADFLVKIAEKSTRERFPVTPQILNRPGDALDLWI